MNILITGGAGNIGVVVTAWLLRQGHTVRVLDIVAPEALEPELAQQLAGATYQQADLSDFPALVACCHAMDAIVHLAGIPHLVAERNAEIFTVNVAGTFNLYQAAADVGIKRVVSASSINALGNGFGIRPVDIQYFPIDEAHPGHTTDSYSFSKQILEEIAAYFWRRDGISSVCFRFPYVFNAARAPLQRVHEFRQLRQEAFDRVMTLPIAQRRTEMDGLLASYRRLRAQHSRGEIDFGDLFRSLRDQPGGALLFGVDDFWAILDVNDAARAIERALLADYSGCHPLYVADARNSTGLPACDLAALFYPGVTTWQRPVEETGSLINTDLATRLIGFEPPRTLGID